jgi:hypothetical protein
MARKTAVSTRMRSIVDIWAEISQKYLCRLVVAQTFLKLQITFLIRIVWPNGVHCVEKELKLRKKVSSRNHPCEKLNRFSFKFTQILILPHSIHHRGTQRIISGASNLPLSGGKHSRVHCHLHGAESATYRQFIPGVTCHRRFICGVSCDDIRWREWHFRWDIFLIFRFFCVKLLSRACTSSTFLRCAKNSVCSLFIHRESSTHKSSHLFYLFILFRPPALPGSES